MDPLVTIETYSRVIDARLAQVRLESAGIGSFLLDESVASIDPFLINAIGGVKLQVKLADEQRARDLLSRPLPETSMDDLDDDAPRCPQCDSEYVFGTGGDGATLKCTRCNYAGASEEFVPKARSAGGSGAAMSNAAAPKTPVFRLERRRGLLGGLMGFAVGFIVT